MPPYDPSVPDRGEDSHHPLYTLIAGGFSLATIILAVIAVVEAFL